MHEVQKNLLLILRTFINGKEKNLFEEAEVNSIPINEIFAMAAYHSVLPIVSEVLFKAGILEEGEMAELYRKASYVAFMRWQQQTAELSKISKIFELHKIPYIPLKGAVIRKLYPEPWLRTSGDIDVLVPENRFEEALKLLTDELQYERKKKTEHDISLSSPNAVNLELHFGFTEKEIQIESVWESAVCTENGYQYNLSSEMFLLHNIAHMAKHFMNGGCGIRPFVDLHFLLRHTQCDMEKLEVQLQACGLKNFADNIFDLLDAWLNNKPLTALQEHLFDYIFSGGVYGNAENKENIVQTKTAQKGQLQYIFSRIFASKSALIFLYPFLRKYPFLYPFCQMHRWIKLLRVKKIKKAGVEIKKRNNFDEKTLAEIDLLLRELGLR